MLKSLNNKNYYHTFSAGKKGGFTLIEATTALIILIVGLLAVMQFFPFALKIIGDSQNLAIASNLALSKVEEIRSLAYSDINVGTIETKQRLSDNPGNYLYSFQRQTVVEYVDSSFNPSVSDVGFKKITVTAFWQSPVITKEKSTQLNIIVSNY